MTDELFEDYLSLPKLEAREIKTISNNFNLTIINTFKHMKKTLLLIAFIIALALVSCKSSLVNYALEKKGFYDEKISVEYFSTENKEIAFFPLQHIGRKGYYDDIQRKIDSLKKQDYVFFYEKVKDDITDTLDYYKFRKILHIGVAKNGYVDLIESIYSSNIKFKYDLVNQPSIEGFGLTAENSFNVDLSIKTIVNNVERTKEISLEECDFENHYTENYKCKDRLLTSEEWKSYLVDDRDTFLVQEIKKSTFPKIALIYGAGHLEGVKKQLTEEN